MNKNETINKVIKQLVEEHIAYINDYIDKKELALIRSKIQYRADAYWLQLHIVSKFSEESYNKLFTSIRKFTDEVIKLKSETSWPSMEPSDFFSRWNDKMFSRIQTLQPELNEPDIRALVKSILYPDPWGYNNPKNEDELNLHIDWYRHVELEKHLLCLKLYQEKCEDEQEIYTDEDDNQFPYKPHKDVIYEMYRNIKFANNLSTNAAFDKLKEDLISKDLEPEEYQVRNDPFTFNRSFNKWTNKKNKNKSS